VQQGARPLDLSDPAIPRGSRVAAWADAPALMQLAAAMQRLGLFEGFFPEYAGSRVGPSIFEREWLHPDKLPPNQPDLWSAFLVLGQAEQFMFHSPEVLEHRIEFALEQPRARTPLIEAARARLLARFTYTAFARRLLSFVKGGLSAT